MADLGGSFKSSKNYPISNNLLMHEVGVHAQLAISVSRETTLTC